MSYSKMTKKQQAEAVARCRAKKRQMKGIAATPKPAKAKGLSKSVLMSVSRLSLWKWGNLFFSAKFYRRCSPVHEELANAFQEVILDGGQYAFCLPRGSAKTTWTQIACMWAILEGHRKYLALLAANRELAVELLEGIKSELENNALLLQAYPDVCRAIRVACSSPQKALRLTDDVGEDISFSWRTGMITMPQVGKSSGSIIQVKGILSASRGMKHTLPDGTDVRPELIFVDDPQDDETASNPRSVAKLERVIQAGLLGLAAPGKKLSALIAGTILQPHDLMDRLTDREIHPAWQGVRVSMVKSWATNAALWQEYLELRKKAQADGDRSAKPATEFYRLHQIEMDEGAEVYWKDRFNPDELSAIQSAYNLLIDRGESVFYSEYQNAPVTSTTTYYSLTADDVLEKCNGRAKLELPKVPVTISAGIDYNRYGLSWTLLATTQAMQSSIIAYGVYQPDGKPIYESSERGYSDAEAIALCKALKGLLKQLSELKIFNNDGQQQRIKRIGIDSGYFTGTVKDFVRSNQATFSFEIYSTKGFSSDSYYEPKRGVYGEGWKLDGLDGACYINTDAIRETWQLGLLLPAGAPTGVDIYGSASEHRELAQQLSAEQMTLKAENTKGRLKYQWTCAGRNDLADALGVARVMASMGGCSAVSTLTPALPNAATQSQQEQPKSEAKPAPVDEPAFDTSAWQSY